VRDGSFDHLVGALLEMDWHVETECLGGLEVDQQMEFRRFDPLADLSPPMGG
jgi:hypothetical protein